MPQSLASLASRIGRGRLDPSEDRVYLRVLGRGGRPDPSEPGFQFQYWPETLSDSKAVNWQAKEIPGGSLPVYQWTSSGERSVSFTGIFTSDTVRGDVDFPQGAADPKFRNRNPDVRSAVIWLRRMMLPSYAGQLTQPPPFLLLTVPNSGIGLAGGSTYEDDSIPCAMTQCEVSWDKFFRDGTPKVASVQLAFAEVPQHSGTVSFPRNDARMLTAARGGGVFEAATGQARFYRGYPLLGGVR